MLYPLSYGGNTTTPEHMVDCASLRRLFRPSVVVTLRELPAEDGAVERLRRFYIVGVDREVAELGGHPSIIAYPGLVEPGSRSPKVSSYLRSTMETPISKHDRPRE